VGDSGCQRHACSGRSAGALFGGNSFAYDNA
jgi:hypothetical protein